MDQKLAAWLGSYGECYRKSQLVGSLSRAVSLVRENSLARLVREIRGFVRSTYPPQSALKNRSTSASFWAISFGLSDCYFYLALMTDPP
jgi:hypothetical protein